MTQTTALTVPLAVEADGMPIVVDFAATPHVTVVMPTGYGKTTTAQWMIKLLTWTGTCAALVDVINPTCTSYHPVAGTPGVWVHSDPAAQLETVSGLHEEMHRRYAAASDGVADLAAQPPRFLVIDGLNTFAWMAKKWDRPAHRRLLRQLVDIFSMGGTAGIHVIATFNTLVGFDPVVRDLCTTGVVIAGYGPNSADWQIGFGGRGQIPEGVTWPSREWLAYGTATTATRFGVRGFTTDADPSLTWLTHGFASSTREQS